jgi:hypothetical protein
MIHRLLIGTGIVAAIACGSLFSYARYLGSRAQFIVQTTYELSEGKQSPSVASIREHFGRSLQQDECSGSECSYTVALSNRILAAFHIVPYTEMSSYFWTRDGVVLRNMLEYSTTVSHGHRIVSHVQIDFCKECQMVAIHPWDSDSPLDTNGLIMIGNEASSQSHRTVLSVNTRCLTRVGGCRTVADLLPAVWKQTAGAKITCVIQNDRGMVEKPANWP